MTIEQDFLRPRLRHAAGADIALYVDERIEPDPRAVEQLERLAAAPGVVSPVVALPDIHYKGRNPAPTGAVVAVEGGLIPLAIDAGLNCGMRVHVLDAAADEMGGDTVQRLFAAVRRRVPTGWHEQPVLTDAEMQAVLEHGAAWVVDRAEGRGGPVARIENGGRLPAAQVRAALPDGAWRRGRRGLGVLGGGNHFLELHVVDEVLHPHAELLGLRAGQLLVILHSGSGVVGKTVGLFYGARDEWSGRRKSQFLAEKVAYHLRAGDRRTRLGHFRAGRFRLLAEDSSEGRRLQAAMAAAANFGYANRASLGAAVEQAVAEVFGPAVTAGLLYDVSHNMVQREEHGGRALFVHRQGASRALPPSRMTHDPLFAVTGQPFPVPGSMGAASYICVARETAEATFYSANHGAGRVLDKPEARRAFTPEAVSAQMAERRITLFKEGAAAGLAEQAPGAFKDITAVIDVMARTGIATPVVRTSPLGVLKG
jgi:tRNA-splicing ligase RtcB (3'-phosphate/5'-hydroxy nucleic acid ligase)